MNKLLLIIAVMLYTQPTEAGLCDMDTNPVMDQHLEHSIESEHDCCDNDSSGEHQACKHAMQCGSHSASSFSFITFVNIAPGISGAFSWNYMAGALAPSHTLPLYRPPIS